MNCAFLFSGQMRGFTHALPEMHNKLFSQFDGFDTYFYIPDEDLTEVNVSSLQKLKPNVLCFEKDSLKNSETKDISHKNNITFSKPKIEKNEYILKNRMEHYILQWYGVYRCFQLFQEYVKINNIKYDLVCRLRCDHIPWENFPIDKINKDTLNIPLCHNKTNIKDYLGGVYDRFAIGPIDTIKIYCEKYLSILKDNIGHGNSELKLLEHLRQNNIDRSKINRLCYLHDRLNNDGTVQSDR